MIRAVLLLGLGLGFIGVPHAAWLAAFALALTAIFRLPELWGGRKAASLGVRIVPAGSHHFHYCPACDVQWPHPGEGTSCTDHWARPCPACTAPARPDEPRVA